MKPLGMIGAVMACLLAGCGQAGPRTCRVEGVVSIDGTMAASGSIRFEPVNDGDLPGGSVIVEGRYQAQLTPGPKVIRLAVEGSRDGLKPTDLSPNIVPKKYLSEPPTVEITKSERLDFLLTSERGG